MKFICDVFYWNSSKKDEAVRAVEIVKAIYRASELLDFHNKATASSARLLITKQSQLSS